GTSRGAPVHPAFGGAAAVSSEVRPVNAQSLTDVLARFPGLRVMVVGDLMLDEYVVGTVRRVSPEARVPVVEHKFRQFMPGGAGNVAANVHGLLGEAILLGVIGRDDSGQDLVHALRGYHISEISLLKDRGRRTTHKLRILADGQQLVRVDEDECTPLSATQESTLLERAASTMSDVDAVLISDY